MLPTWEVVLTHTEPRLLVKDIKFAAPTLIGGVNNPFEKPFSWMNDSTRGWTFQTNKPANITYWPTVDGSEIPNNHLGCTKPWKIMGFQLPTSTGSPDFRTINSSTETLSRFEANPANFKMLPPKKRSVHNPLPTGSMGLVYLPTNLT